MPSTNLSEKADLAHNENTPYSWSQSLKRRMMPFKTIATTLTMASVLTGIVPLTHEGLMTGGPAMMVIGFAVTGLMVLNVGLSLAEIASSFPGVRGGLVEYTRRLSPPGHLWQRIGPWTVGWLHFLAYTLGTASVCFSFALFATAGIQVAQGMAPPRIVTVAIHIAVVSLCGATSALKIELDLFSMIWQALGLFIVLITVIAAQRNPPSAVWVFTHFENQTGWDNKFYVCWLGFVLGGFTFTGYDGSIHSDYNTPNAERKVPQGILVGCLTALMMGELLILTLLFAISDLDAVMQARGTGQPGLEIFLLLLGRNGCLGMLFLFLGTFFFCAQGVLKAATEIGHELATLNVLPWPDYFAQANHRGRPARVSWLVSGISGAVGLLYLINSTALIALTSVVAIELNIAYTIPVVTRLLFPDPGHVRNPAGPFSLGRWSKVVNLVAVTWAGLCTVILCFPTAYPITTETMNYACILLVLTLLFIFGYWQYSGRHWYGRIVRGNFADQLHHLDIIRTMTKDLGETSLSRHPTIAPPEHLHVVAGDDDGGGTQQHPFLQPPLAAHHLTRQEKARLEENVLSTLGFHQNGDHRSHHTHRRENSHNPSLLYSDPFLPPIHVHAPTPSPTQPSL